MEKALRNSIVELGRLLSCRFLVGRRTGWVGCSFGRWTNDFFWKGKGGEGGGGYESVLQERKKERKKEEEKKKKKKRKKERKKECLKARNLVRGRTTSRQSTGQITTLL